MRSQALLLGIFQQKNMAALDRKESISFREMDSTFVWIERFALWRSSWSSCRMI